MTKPTHRPPLQASHGEQRFLIEFGGEGIGYYLYVYDENRCTEDHLQDTLYTTQRFALEQFGVPIESWTDADETV